MAEIILILDEERGEMVVEDNPAFREAAIELLQNNLGEATEIACARPLKIIELPVLAADASPTVRIAGYYHNSLTEGPGRRSSVIFQSCPLKCKGCYVPELHSAQAGQVISVRKLAELLLDSKYQRDGVSILGGEPFAQAEGLNALVKELRSMNCPHIVCYSGYTLEVLREKAIKHPEISQILNDIDLLVDGPFIESLAGEAGLWTGSGNQRVIDLKTTQKQGQTVLF